MTGALRQGALVRLMAAFRELTAGVSSRVPTFLAKAFAILIPVQSLILPNVYSVEVLSVRFPNILTWSVVYILVSLVYVGRRALRMTVVDVVVYLWMLLATASHLYASIFLERLMFEQYLLGYLIFLVSMWSAYRVTFAAVILRPSVAIKFFQNTLLIIFMVGGVMGILQTFGSIGPAVTSFAASFSGIGRNVLEGAGTGRPTAWYGGPNIFGFFNALGVAVLAGWTMARARTINNAQTAFILAGLATLTYSTVNSQSRTAVFSIIVTLAILLVTLLRAKQYAKVITAVAIVGGIVTLAIVLGGDRFSYLTGTFEQDLTRDSSYLVRQLSFVKLAGVANEAAVLGLGVSQVNNPAILGISGYDYFYVPGVDNEWANIYQAHGVMGVVLILSLYLTIARLALANIRDAELRVRTLGYQAMSILVVLAVNSPAAVRMGKGETAGIMFAFMGILAGVREVRKGRNVVSVHAPAPLPTLKRLRALAGGTISPDNPA